MSLVLRIALFLLAAAAALAENGSVSQRLRRALSPFGQAETASQAFAKGDFGKIENILNTLNPSNQAEHAELLSLKGAVEFLAGRMDDAAAAFREAATLAPLDESDSFTLAMALIKLENDAEARAVLESLAKQHPENALYLYWLGRIDYDQRRYTEASEKLSEVTKLDPLSARAWDSLGLVFDMQGRPDDALGAFRRAVNLNRNQTQPSPWPPHNLGYLLLRMDKLSEAEAALRESLGYDPKMPQAHYHLGRVLEKEERSAEAIEEYSASVSLDRSSSEPCYSLAMLYRKLHKDAEANAMFAEYRTRKEVLSH